MSVSENALPATVPAGRPSGFTLTLDGAPDEVGRVLAAVWREMAAVESAAVARRHELWRDIPPTWSRVSTLRGAVDVRYPLSPVPDRSAVGIPLAPPRDPGKPSGGRIRPTPPRERVLGPRWLRRRLAAARGREYPQRR